MILMDKFNSQG